jgi:glucokinase
LSKKNSAHNGRMRILAADIGGTNSRFASVEINGLSSISVGEPFVFPTWLDSIGSLQELLHHFQQNAPGENVDPGQYHAISLGVAGAVDKGKATLPNISWDIDLATIRNIDNIYLLNDFLAQAYACLDENLLAQLETVRPGPGFGHGSLAIIGAGTGLGHAALKPHAGTKVVIGSESGHATFAFHGEEEREIEQFFITRTGKKWISNDDVVSGSGAALLHECLTGESVIPAEALSAEPGNTQTCALFSRFYARACRNYCLAMHPVEKLIITGGIAAKNPHLVCSGEFIDEFNDAQHYSHLFETIPIFLNSDQGLGIKGAAIYAWLLQNPEL